MKSQGYLTRAMQSSDPRFLQVLLRVGYTLPDAPDAPAQSGGGQTTPAPSAGQTTPVPEPEETEDEKELKKVREDYERVTGKRPYYAWDAAELRRRIADFRKEEAQAHGKKE
ncbi:hypothetical protein ELH77_19350 [Rhizobium ruizarguesonis]|uniref:hypothetical protein n=1 Tax=Rhizobium ruizarguesonis TaxID=2081791 RepID=UPI001030B46B|nr:hypothetical protein [Rhizobium ruizarguesonis]TAZ20763.1 hypothetical protein ELH77_19350 [Rhizobium ruizarguesonis]